MTANKNRNLLARATSPSMTGRIITLKYDKDRYSDPRPELSAPPSVPDYDHTPTNQPEDPPDTLEMEFTPTKIVKLQYRRSRTNSSQSSPIKSLERRNINRTPTPSLPMAAGDLTTVPNLSREGSRSYSGSATPPRSTSPAEKPVGEATATVSSRSGPHITTAPVTYTSVQTAIKSIASDDDPQAYLHSIHIITSRLHLLKEAYRSVQTLKRRKLQAADSSSVLADTTLHTSQTGPNFALELYQYPLSSPFPKLVSSPTLQENLLLNRHNSAEGELLQSSQLNLDDSAAEDTEPTQEPAPVSLMN
ncbi:uncharacterized protein CANTADRAFT_21947 [Suhomyces tanzawaensis NRRL Y-17324]|uniref:Uncharacterized protein n=1 Tax=Suhomyces tanzawaensis NRRL Y-17324 TaxID=984487 RepID=A0A1E4SI44_9ASCO|nr:uncharacterized protein CANTADRAFT_21947 [Suhomyces tanzawaensis NRRL Y-17324]ODV79184.1 hypothetical protein CANTADRAFT_21947 [Suhomyces tanzawaensis NRRL Y-17324]